MNGEAHRHQVMRKAAERQLQELRKKLSETLAQAGFDLDESAAPDQFVGAIDALRDERVQALVGWEDARQLLRLVAKPLGLTDPSDGELAALVSRLPNLMEQRPEGWAKLRPFAKFAWACGVDVDAFQGTEAELVDHLVHCVRATAGVQELQNQIIQQQRSAPTLTNTPLPEGREGESIVVADGPTADVYMWHPERACWYEAEYATELHPGEALSYEQRWAYVVRVVG